jgi:iron(III) transport system ATP-binding protein
MQHSAILELNEIVKKFPASETKTLDRVSFTLASGELMGLLGPSGCGKTTLLRIIAGFEEIDRGSIVIAGKTASSSQSCLPPEKRNTGMVFQDYALFPHLTVGSNIAFGLKSTRYSDKNIKHRVKEVLELVGLAGLEKRYPHQLSGGQQQRVALARALAPQPSLILLDEPLSNLDVQVRQRLREEIRLILKAAGTSAIFVTHDREEALAISDRLAVMKKGRIEQIGTPEAIYIQPASRFVAEFVTQANFLPARRQGQLWHTEIGAVEIINSAIASHCDRGDLMIRQEELVLAPDDNSDVIITERQFLGREYRYSLVTASGKRLHARTASDLALAVGTKVNLTLPHQTARIFPDRNFLELNKEAATIGSHQ